MSAVLILNDDHSNTTHAPRNLGRFLSSAAALLLPKNCVGCESFEKVFRCFFFYCTAMLYKYCYDKLLYTTVSVSPYTSGCVISISWCRRSFTWLTSCRRNHETMCLSFLSAGLRFFGVLAIKHSLPGNTNQTEAFLGQTFLLLLKPPHFTRASTLINHNETRISPTVSRPCSAIPPLVCFSPS